MSKREAYQKALEQLKAETLTDTVSFKLRDRKPSIFESKAGGTPYIPRDAVIPEDSYGNQLRFLAQVDCENLKSLPDFPHKGLLQFFISNSDVLGLLEKDGFMVYYYENVDRTVTEDECKSKLSLANSEDEYFPVAEEYSMEFTPCKMSITERDFRYDELARSKLDEEIDEFLYDEIFYEDEYYDDQEDDDKEGDDYKDDGCGKHRLGGYPYFTQFDPRYAEREYTVLLFQLNSDYDECGNEIVMWGDCGVCNFFIKPEDLKKRDFTKVLYNWDCC